MLDRLPCRLIQRQAARGHRRAGELAGLKVERLISEPTAAALAYGSHERDRQTGSMRSTWGGGTDDMSILEIWRR